VGSLGTVLQPGRTSVLDLVEQAAARGVFISYDPNLRESFVEDRDRTWQEVRSLGARCTLVKLSDEDADVLVPDSDPAEVARTLLTGASTALVLLTRGADGATAFIDTGEASARPRQVRVVDTVGAGDAFMAATLAQLSDVDGFRSGPPTDTSSLERLVAGAVEASAVTCERRGADPPRREDLPPGWPA
jgi:fructokinase